MFIHCLSRSSRFLLVFSLIMVLPKYAYAQGCTPAEVERIINGVNRMVYSIQAGDLQAYIRQASELQNSLSQSCQTQLMRAQQVNPYGGGQNPYGGGATPYRPPSVYDHGGGTYSMPGVGACGPSGCMAFD